MGRGLSLYKVFSTLGIDMKYGYDATGLLSAATDRMPAKLNDGVEYWS